MCVHPKPDVCFNEQPSGPRVLLIGDSVDRNAVSEWCAFAEKGRYELIGHSREGADLPSCKPFAKDLSNSTIRQITLPKFDQRLYVCVKNESYPHAAAAFVFNEMGTDLHLHCANQYYRPADAKYEAAAVPTAALWKQCLAKTIVPIIDSIHDALGGLDGIIIQSTLWDVAIPFEADKTSPLFTGGPNHEHARHQFMLGWERNMSTFLDYMVPYFKGINGVKKTQPWVAWRTINYVHNKTGLHYFNMYGQNILEDMKRVGVAQAMKHGMDLVPYHLFPGSHLRRDDVHPNLRSSATLVEYAIHAVDSLRKQKKLDSNPTTRLIPESVKLELIEKSYQIINEKADAKYATLNQSQKKKQKSAWTIDGYWHRSSIAAWERYIVEARKDPAKEAAVYTSKLHHDRNAPQTLKPKDIHDSVK